MDEHESELLAKAKNGDEQAFMLLLEKSNDKIRASIYSQFSRLNREDFLDAQQISSLKAWTHLKTFQETCSFTGWYHSIIRNELYTICNRNSRRFKREISGSQMPYQSLDKGEDFFDNSGQVVEAADNILLYKEQISQYQRLIKSALEELDPIHREILKVILEDGLNYKEASTTLDIPLGTVMSRLYYARKHAQKIIKKYAACQKIQLSVLV